MRLNAFAPIVGGLIPRLPVLPAFPPSAPRRE
jgi:hypothetical protein